MTNRAFYGLRKVAAIRPELLRSIASGILGGAFVGGVGGVGGQLLKNLATVTKPTAERIGKAVRNGMLTGALGGGLGVYGMNRMSSDAIWASFLLGGLGGAAAN